MGKHLGPGESMLLVKTATGLMETPAQFRAWWGEENLRENLQIITYIGHNFDSTGASSVFGMPPRPICSITLIASWASAAPSVRWKPMTSVLPVTP